MQSVNWRQLQAAAIGLFQAALPRDPPAFLIFLNPLHFIIFPLTIRGLDSLLCSRYNYFCLFRQSAASKQMKKLHINTDVLQACYFYIMTCKLQIISLSTVSSKASSIPLFGVQK